MELMELKIISPKEDQFVKSIEFNFEELKKWLAAKVQHYNTLVYTEETIKVARQDRAALNKFKEALEDKRKEIKKMCLQPYEAFEKKMKQLTALVDKPIQAIDGQIKSYENAKKAEKKSQIQAYYDEKIGDLKNLLSFDRIFEERWLNVNVSMKEICAAIDESIRRVSDGLAAIDSLDTEFKLQVKDVFLRTFDLTAALQEKARLEQQKAMLAEYDARSSTDTSLEARRLLYDTASLARERIYQVDFRVWATEPQLRALKQFLKSNGIKYGRIE